MQVTGHFNKQKSSFIGIEDYTIVRAEGGGVLDMQEVLDKAKKDAEEAASHFVTSSTITV